MSSMLRRQLWWAGLALSLVVLASISPAWIAVQSAGQSVLAPVAGRVHQLADYLSTLGRAHVLEAQNEELRQQLAASAARTAAYEQLQQENDRLRELAGFKPVAGISALGVEVIGEQSDEAGRRYIVNRGTRDGLAVGQPLVAGYPAPDASGSAPAVVLVGTVIEAGRTTASFVSTTSPASRVLAQVVNDERSQGMLIGEFNVGLRLTYLPPNDKVGVGASVVTSNLSEEVPAGILIGHVTSVENIEGAFFQTATVVPPVSLDSFRFLYVLKQEGT